VCVEKERDEREKRLIRGVIQVVRNIQCGFGI